MDYIETSRICGSKYIMIPWWREGKRERKRENLVQSIVNESRSTTFLLFSLFDFFPPIS